MNAQQRILAARKVVARSTTLPHLKQFYASLSPEQQEYFSTILPKTLFKWFDGMNSDAKSEHLNLTAAKTTYKEVDALAISLMHLKRIYPARVLGKVYRVLLVPDKGTQFVKRTGQTEFKSDRKYRPLQSWTTDPNLDTSNIAMRRGMTRKVTMEADTMDVRQYIVATMDSVIALCHDTIEMFEETGAKQPFMAWKNVRNKMRSYEHEKEVMLYIPAGKSIPVTWTSSSLYEEEFS